MIATIDFPRCAAGCVINGIGDTGGVGKGVPTIVVEKSHEPGVADENIAYNRIAGADVVDTHAYVVLSANLSFTLKGQRATRLGILAFTLARQGDE
jgi:hypothetical protein